MLIIFSYAQQIMQPAVSRFSLEAVASENLWELLLWELLSENLKELESHWNWQGQRNLNWSPVDYGLLGHLAALDNRECFHLEEKTKES